ncbi:MAG: toxin-antitoxin system TumE family protein [bacterium]
MLDIVLNEYNSIVESGEIIYTQSQEPWKLRLYFYDGSFLDVFYSKVGKYSYHWERRFINNSIYRHDNAPHKNWEKVKTFPKHFHNGTEENVIESYISDNPEEAIREFLDFIRNKILQKDP